MMIGKSKEEGKVCTITLPDIIGKRLMPNENRLTVNLNPSQEELQKINDMLGTRMLQAFLQ